MKVKRGGFLGHDGKDLFVDFGQTILPAGVASDEEDVVYEFLGELHNVCLRGKMKMKSITGQENLNVGELTVGELTGTGPSNLAGDVNLKGAGVIGFFHGTIQGGTGGAAYATRTTTTMGTSAANVVVASVVVDKGLWLVSASVEALFDASVGLHVTLDIGTVAIAGLHVETVTGWGAATLPAYPVHITADGTSIDLSASQTITAGNAVEINILNVVRIA